MCKALPLTLLEGTGWGHHTPRTLALYHPWLDTDLRLSEPPELLG